MKKIRKNRGITLISLVVTIIVLLILAGITINMLFGKNGLLNRATEATEEYSKSEAREKIELLLSEYTIEKATGENTDFAKFLRENLQVGVAQNEDDTYSFMLGEWQVVATENEVISIEKFKIDVDKIYPSVASMKADTELTDGQLVQTEGYWDKQYGGSAYYDIVSSTSLAVDDGKCIQLDNGLYAELHAINDTVTVNQFGAYGDGNHDDAEAIENALNSEYGNITFESEEYMTDNIIIIQKSNVNILGSQSTISMKEGFNIPINYFIYITGTETEYINNIAIYNLSIKTGSVERSYNDAVQLMTRYVNGLEIQNCNFSVSEDAEGHTTNIWITGSCSNINIQDNSFVNLSNSDAGGNIWISEQTSSITQNISISNNYIEKSSHDESIAIWQGRIENVTVNNNEFLLNDENLENPSDMNFRIGNDDTNEVKNVKFINNKITSQSKWTLFTINTMGDATDDVLIENNSINHTYLLKNDGSELVENLSGKNNITIKNNEIIINAKFDESMLFSLCTGNSRIVENNITINNKVRYILSYIENVIFDNNNVTINNDITAFAFNTSGEFKNNKIEINNISSGIFIYSSTDKAISSDIDISNNIFNINDNTEWSESSKRFIDIYKTKINNHKINIRNNAINTTNKSNNQLLVFLQELTDENIQRIYFENNNCGIFKNIQFYSNPFAHIVVINSKEFNTNATID